MAGAPAEEAPDGLSVPLADPAEDWEVFINFEPRFPTPSLPAVSLGIESSIRQPGSTPQNQQVLVYSHAPVICAQKSRKQDEIPRKLISIGNGHPSITARSPAVSETRDEGPHLSASSTISSNKVKSTKRRFDACISSFSSGEDPSQQPRKRQGYLAERRKEVAKMRKVGACQRCRMRKLTVSSFAKPTIGFWFKSGSAKRADHATVASTRLVVA
jgi:hypothetical protein